MSGTIGYEYVKLAVSFAFGIVAGGIKLFKNREAIVAEVKDTQVDEIIDLVMNDVRQGIVGVLEAVKA